MLTFFKKNKNNLMLKIFLLLVLISFIFTGAGNLFEMISSDKVVKIKNIGDISYEEYTRTLRNEVNRLEYIFGSQINEQSLKQLNIEKIVLDQLVKQKFLEHLIKQLKFNVGNKILYEEIASIPAFLDQDNKFSSEKFKEILTQQSISENSFIESYKKEYLINQLLTALTSNFHVEPKLVKMISRYYQESRIFDLYQVKLPKINKEPKLEDLNEYYQKHKNKFFIAEKRAFEFTKIGTDKINELIKNDKKLSEENLKQIYNERQNDLIIPEKRDFYQLTFENEDEAVKFLTENKFDNKYLQKQYTKDQLEKEISDIIFELDINAPVKIVKIQDKWNLFKLVKNYPEYLPSFEQISKELYEEVKNEVQYEKLEEIISNIEEKLADNVSLQEIAKEYDLKIFKTDLQEQADLIVNYKLPYDITSKLFSADFKNNQTELFNLEDEKEKDIIVIKQTSVQEKQYKTLEQAKAELTEEYNKNLSRKVAINTAELLHKHLNENNSEELGKLLQKEYVHIFTNKEKKRYENDKNDYNPALHTEIFSCNIGDSTKVIDNQDSYYVAKIKSNYFPESVNTNMLQTVQNNLNNNIGQEIVELYLQYQLQRHPVKYNKKLLSPATLSSIYSGGEAD